MIWSEKMNLSFSSATLAVLCNSEERLVQRWGQDTGKIVGRRLLDLAAATVATLDRIPGALVKVDGTETTITFADKIAVRGVIGPSQAQSQGLGTDEDMVITSIVIQGSVGR